MESLIRKEVLILLPLFGTILAVSFDVGYFFRLDINLFNIFSVSEHIAFALQLVPFITLASLIIVVCSLAEGYLKHKQANRTVNVILMITLLVAVTLAALAYFQFRTFFLIFVIGVGFIAIGIVGLIIILPRNFLQYNVLVMTAATLLIIAALVLGLDTARRQQNSKNFGYSITTAETELTGRVLRSGERGLLVIERNSQGIVLLPWREVRKIAERKSASSGNNIPMPPAINEPL